MTSSFINQVRARLFARGAIDVSNAALKSFASPMQALSRSDLKMIIGGDSDAGDAIDGSPKGSWKTSTTSA